VRWLLALLLSSTICAKEYAPGTCFTFKQYPLYQFRIHKKYPKLKSYLIFHIFYSEDTNGFTALVPKVIPYDSHIYIDNSRLSYVDKCNRPKYQRTDFPKRLKNLENKWIKKKNQNERTAVGAS